MDESFQNWVLQTSGIHSSFWSRWLDNHPEKKDVVEKARALILKLKTGFNGADSPPAADEVWANVLKTIAGSSHDANKNAELNYPSIIK